MTAEPSSYRLMWLLCCFDLPVTTKEQRKAHTRFRTSLLREGFTMLQFSVYLRFCGSEDRADVFRDRVCAALPSAGEVRLIAITDRQFGKMVVYRGKDWVPAERAPPQLSLF